MLNKIKLNLFINTHQFKATSQLWLEYDFKRKLFDVDDATLTAVNDEIVAVY